MTVAMEEYRSLRAEALAAIDRQQRIVAAGTTTAGLLLALGANAAPGSTLAVLLLLVLEPLLAWLVTVMWLGEVERMVRAGAYISMLEQRIGREFEEQPLQWESRLRREAPGGRAVLTPLPRRRRRAAVRPGAAARGAPDLLQEPCASRQ